MAPRGALRDGRRLGGPAALRLTGRATAYPRPIGTVGRRIGERLREAGVRYVMGHPGGEVVDLIEGLRAAGLEFVLTRHETSAAFMADAMAAASGIPGVCVATLGPGATNLVTGVAQAFLDRSPVLAFTGQLPTERFELTTHQKLGLRELYAPITKWQTRVSASNASEVVERALRVALRPRRGPVYLEVPSDVSGRDAPDEGRPAGYAPRPMPPEATPAIEAGVAGAAAQRLRQSRRPLILVGMDANDEVTGSRLAALAEEWSIPVIDSPKAKGVFREDHPLFLGTIEMLGTAVLYEEIARSDLVLMIGVDPVELDRDWPNGPEVVHLGVLPDDDRYYRAAIEVVGPPHEAIDAIRSLCGTPEPKWTPDEVRRLHASFRAHVTPRRAGLTPQEVLATLRAELSEDAIATCDVGYNKAVTGQCWTAYRARSFFMSNGLSSMGYGLPAALGLKLLHRDRPVLCVLGDGGFAMTMAELETAARMELGVIVVVLADGALSQIRAGQERRGYPPTGTTFRGLDHLAIARGFGALGFDVTTVAECRDAVRAARAAGSLALIAAHVDPTAYSLTERAGPGPT